MADQSTQRIPVTKSTRRVRLDEDQTEAYRVIRGELNSKQVEDPFKQFYAIRQGDLHIIEPPRNFNALLRMTEENAMLRQCIEALVTNIEGHGFQMAYTGEDGGEEADGPKQERENIEAFFDAPNESYSLIELRTRCRWDLECLGNAYIEVARNPKGEVTAMWHIPAQMMRVTQTDELPTKVKAKLARKTGTVEQVINKHFRRYVQMVGTRRIYFKEFGDPRPISTVTGNADETLTHEDTATEVIHLRLYNPGSAYGVPRWLTQAPSIKGSRQAELTNLEFFSDNAIPAMLITVSGGSVDQTSIDAVEDHFQAARGRKAQNRIVVLEAKGDEHAAAENGTIAPPKVEIKSLQGERQGDALFQQYEKDCHSKVRSSFRLPPIFVGLSEDYNYATAKTAFEVAESQVFGPERGAVDDVINRKILATWAVKNWEFRSNPPSISDPEEMLKAVEAFEKVGAMTPNTAIGLANEMFDLDMPMIEDDWGNWPFEMVKELGKQGRLKGMDAFVEKLEIPEALGGDPAKPGDTNKPGDTKGKEPATPFTGKGGGKGKPPADTKQKAQQVVRDALLDLRAALANPERDVVEINAPDLPAGTVVRHRARK